MSLKIDQQPLIQNEQPTSSHAAEQAPTHSQEQTGRSPSAVRQESTYNTPTATLQGVTAASRQVSFFTRVGQWFSRHFSATPAWKLPEKLEIPLPNGGYVTYPGNNFSSSVRAIPQQHRTEFIHNLPTMLADRIHNGQQLIQSILHNKPADPTVDNISDMMLFLDAKTRAEGKGFERGAFSIEDPQGKILAFLNSCPDKYLRSSTHMTSLQATVLPTGQSNIHRGIDIPPGSHGLPHNLGTMLFAAIPAREGASQRVFLKMETYGCRLSNLPARERAAGQDTFGERPVNWRSDLGNAFGHLGKLIRSHFVKVPDARREDVPTALLRDYNAICTQSRQQGHITDTTLRALTAGSAKKSSCSVQLLMNNMRNAYKQASSTEKSALATMYRHLIESMESHLDDTDFLGARLGNEKMFSAADISQGISQEPRASLQKYEKTAAILEYIAEPMTAHLATCLQDVTIELPTELLRASSDLLTFFFYASGSLEALTPPLNLSIRNALSRLSLEEKQRLYSQLTSDVGSLHSAAASYLLTQMRSSTPDSSPLAARIGGIAYHDILLTGLINELKSSLGISQQDSLAHIAPEQTIQTNFSLAAQKQLANVSQGISAQGIAQTFIQDSINRGTEFTIDGTPCNDAQTFMTLIPNTALRIAVSSLANQESAAFGQELMAQLDMAPVLEGDPELTFHYTQDDQRNQGTLEMHYVIPYRHLITPTGLIELKGTVEQTAHFTFNTNAQTPRGAFLKADAGTLIITVR